MRKRNSSGPIFDPETGRGEGGGQLGPRNGLEIKTEVKWLCNVMSTLVLPQSAVVTYLEVFEAPF